VSKIVNWGHWLVAGYFGLQGLWNVSWVAHAVLIAVRNQSETFYPTYMALFDSWVLLACSWGILKMRRWGYPLAFAVSALEILVGIVGFSVSGPIVSKSSFVFGHMHFDGGFILIIAVVPSLILAWLSLPAVRTQYLHKELPA
jgi:hypothetical protein